MQISMKNNVKLSFIKLGLFFHLEKTYLRFIVAFLMGAISGFAVFVFLKGSGLYSSGLSGLSQGFARIAYAQTNDKVLFDVLFWCLFGFINFPLIIFAYFKIGKKFAYSTFIYNTTSIFMGIILDSTISQDTYIRNIFGNPQIIAASADARLLIAQQTQISIMAWSGSSPDITLATGASIAIIAAYISCYMVIMGFVFAVIYITGGSTGGTDIIAFYWAEKKKKSVSYLIILINVLSLIAGYVFGSYIAFGLKSHLWEISWFLSPILLMSYINTVAINFVSNSLFSRYKLIEISVITENGNKLTKSLIEDGYIHGLTITEATGAYTGNKKQNITSVVNYYELSEIISKIITIDPKSFIKLSNVLSVVGSFRVPSTKNIEEMEELKYTKSKAKKSKNV